MNVKDALCHIKAAARVALRDLSDDDYIAVCQELESDFGDRARAKEEELK